MTQHFIFRFLMLPLVSLAISIGLAAAADAQPTARDQEAEIYQQIQRFQQELQKTHTNPYRQEVTVFTNPQQVLALIQSFEQARPLLVKALTDIKAPTAAYSLPVLFQEPVMTALKLLYCGRGRSSKTQTDGWHADSEPETGGMQISIILQKGWLDSIGQQEFAAFVQSYDFNDPKNKIRHNFAPNMVMDAVKTESFRQKVLQLVQNAPVHADYDRQTQALSDGAFLNTGQADKLNDEQMQLLQQASVRVLTDKNMLDQQFIFPRDAEVQDVLDVLVRIKDKNPVILGLSGVGKSMMLENIASKILNQDLPQAQEFQKLKNATIIETTPAHISTLAKSDVSVAQVAAVQLYFELIRRLEKTTKGPVIVFMDNMHTLSSHQAQALQSVLSVGGQNPIHFIGVTTNTRFSLMLKDNEAWRRRLQTVQIDELSVPDTLKLLTQQAKVFEKVYKLKFYDSALHAAVQASFEYSPSSLRPEGPYKLLQDVAVAAHREQKTEVSDEDVYLHVTQKLKLPINPYDMENFFSDLEKLRTRMQELVVDQEKMVNALVDLWGQMFLGVGKSHRVMLVAGPTGSGKTYAAQMFAQEALGSRHRLLEVDATNFKTGSMSLNSLIGVPPGIDGGEKSAGLLPEFLEGPGRGVNVILFNELDKASTDFMEMIMEMLDTGHLQAPNGKTYHLGRSLIIFTTNKGHEYIYPRRVGGALSRDEITRRVQNITDAQIRQWFMQASGDNLYDSSQQLDPSVLNRIDKAVPAAPPSREGAVRILQQELARLNEDLKKRLGLRVFVDENVLDQFVRLVYAPEDGVRDLNNVLRAKVTQAIQQAYDKLDFKKGQDLQLSWSPQNTRHADASDPDAHDADAGDSVSRIAPEQKNQVVFDLKVRGAGGSQKTVIEGPRSDLKNPLLFLSHRDQMKNISSTLQQQVYGQGEAIESSARAVRARVLNPRDPRPVTLLYLGSTGIGKTHMAKSLAQAVYGHASRYVQFDMGRVKWEGDLQNIFGSSQGFVGSNKMSAFEKALNDFSEGAVLVFDEIGHMGSSSNKKSQIYAGGNTKDDLLKVFYKMLDEGQWTNAHGTSYNLSQFIVAFTSSEVSDVFSDLPTDDLRLAAWNEVKHPVRLRQILKEQHDWPEDLLGRIGNRVILFQPLVEKSGLQVVRKLVREATEDLRKQNGIKSFGFDDDFYASLLDSFFSHTQGARSLRDFAEGGLVDLIGEVLVDNYDQLEQLKSAHWHFELHDNYKGQISYEGDTLPERKVVLSVRLSNPSVAGPGRAGPDIASPDRAGADRASPEFAGTPLSEVGLSEAGLSATGLSVSGFEKSHWKRDVTGEAVPRTLVSKDQLRAVAIHEAGHAVVNVPAYTGEKVEFISIQPRGGALGYTRYEKVAPHVTLNREEAVYHIARLLAGEEAQVLMNLPYDSGWRSDLERARKLAAQAISNYGLSGEQSNNLSFALRADGTVNFNNSKVQKELKTLMQDGAATARALVKKNKDLLLKVTEALLQKQYLSGKEFAQLESNHDGVVAIESTCTQILTPED